MSELGVVDVGADLTAYNQDNVVRSGLSFLRTVTEAYGAEDGMKIWDAMNAEMDRVDPEVKGKIFFAMLTGQLDGKIVISSYTTNYNKIGLIRAIRMYDTRKLGLKEAKDLSEVLIPIDHTHVGRPIVLDVKSEHYSEAVGELRRAGCIL